MKVMGNAEPSAREHPSHIFSLGYQGRSLESFIKHLKISSVDVVVDVREVPWSRKKGFSKSSMREALEEVGIDYIHAKAAGNPSRIRKTAPSHRECLTRYETYLSDNPDLIREFQSVVGPILDRGLKVCLVCFERHPDDCHRSIFIRYWKRTLGLRFEVEHLAISGTERFLTPQKSAC